MGASGEWFYVLYYLDKPNNDEFVIGKRKPSILAMMIPRHVFVTREGYHVDATVTGSRLDFVIHIPAGRMWPGRQVKAVAISHFTPDEWATRRRPVYLEIEP